MLVKTNNNTHTHTHTVYMQRSAEKNWVCLHLAGREQVRERPRESRQEREREREAAWLLSHHTLLTQSRPPLPYTPSYPHKHTHTSTLDKVSVFCTKLNTYYPYRHIHAQTHTHASPNHKVVVRALL